MKKTLCSLFCALALIADSQAQASYNTQSLEIRPLGKSNFAEQAKHDIGLKIQSLEAPTPGGRADKAFLKAQKALQAQQAPQPQSASRGPGDGDADVPIIGRNFHGNDLNIGVPCDNSMAINNDGILVSVVNQNIAIYDVELDTLLSELTLETFAAPLSITGNKFDPHARFDPDEGKFILCFLNGSTHDQSEIIIAFSETADPTGDWNLYALPGMATADTAWSDYPLLGITDEEFFVTINLIRDGVSWQEGFVESIIWQVDKDAAFAGEQIATTLYTDIHWDGKPIRNLCPVEGGSGIYGPDIYFLSNRNFDLANDTIFMVHLTGTQYDGNTTINIAAHKSNTQYGVPPNGQQASNHNLQTNDSRILDAFVEDGFIHFVGNTNNPQHNRSGVYHGIISDYDSNPRITANILGDSGLDYGYPNITYTGRYFGDNQAIISFNHTSIDSFAGTSAIFFSAPFGYSVRQHIVSGERYVNLLNGPDERWGDYSGAQLVYDEPGNVWMSGFYSKEEIVNNLPRGVNRTWISELSSPGSPPVSGIAPAKEPRYAQKMFPNPSMGSVQLSFDMPESGKAWVQILAADGQVLYAHEYHGIKAGNNLLQFKTDQWAAGQYLVVLSQEGRTIFSEHFQVIGR